MKKVIVIFTMLISVNYSAKSQRINIDSLIKTISNDNFDSIEIDPTSLVIDSSGEIIGRVHRIPCVGCEKYCDMFMMIGNKAIPYLFAYLSDSNRDYAVNILLYKITEKDGIDLYSYTGKEGMVRWRNNQKLDDIVYWKDYLVKKKY